MDDQNFFEQLRQSVDDEALAYNPEDWSHLKQRLEDRRRKRIWFFYLPSFSCLGVAVTTVVLLSITGFYFWNRRQNDLPTRHKISAVDARKISGEEKSMDPVFSIQNKNSVAKNDTSADIGIDRTAISSVIPGTIKISGGSVPANFLSTSQPANSRKKKAGSPEQPGSKRKPVSAKEKQLFDLQIIKPSTDYVDGNLFSEENKFLANNNEADNSKNDTTIHRPDKKIDSLGDIASIPKEKSIQTSTKKPIRIFASSGISTGRNFNSGYLETGIQKHVKKKFYVEAGLNYSVFHASIPVSEMRIEQISVIGVGFIYDTTYIKTNKTATAHYGGLFAGLAFEQKKYSGYFDTYYNFSFLSASKRKILSDAVQKDFSVNSVGLRLGGYYHFNNRHSLGLMARLEAINYFALNPRTMMQLNYRFYFK